MSWTLIGAVGASATGAGAVTTASLDTAGANLIVINNTAFTNGAPSGTPTDNFDNTWTPLARQANGSEWTWLFYCFNPTVGAGHTFTSLGSYSTIEVQAWSGAETSPFDQQNGAAASGVTVQTGSITPSADDALIVTGVMMTATTAVPTINDSFTVSNGYKFTSGDNYGGAMGYLVQGIASAIDPTWTAGASGNSAAVIASFLPASGGTSASITGASSTGAAASLAPSLASAPLGAAAAGTAAAVAPGRSGSAAAIAVFAASGVGALAPSLGTGAAAATATAAAGAVAAGSGTNISVTGAAASGAAGSVAQGAPDPAGAAATGTAAALGIVSEITLSPAASFAVAASVLGTLPAAAAYGIAGPVAGTVPALAADPVFIARGPRVRFTARGPALRFTAIGRVGMRTNDLSPPIAANGETRTVTFDFGPQLAPSVTLTAIAAMNASVHWGYADPTPDERWQGAAQIIASPTTNAPSQAVAQIFGNVPGATVYLLQCEASASDGTTPALETTVTSYVPQ